MFKFVLGQLILIILVSKTWSKNEIWLSSNLEIPSNTSIITANESIINSKKPFILQNTRIYSSSSKFYSFDYKYLPSNDECFHICLGLYGLKCVASQIDDNFCNLFDENFRLVYYLNATSYFVNKEYEICDCPCEYRITPLSKQYRYYNYDPEYTKCIKSQAETFKCVLREQSCELTKKHLIRADITLSYHTKVYENASNHIDCYNKCIETNSFKCLASEIYDRKCYLYDKNFKMEYAIGANVYFANKVDFSICDCDCKDAKEKGLDFGWEYKQQCIKKKLESFICVVKNQLCETKPFINNTVTLYNHKEEHENVNDHYNCYKRCINTKTFNCVASEMNKGTCYLYDDSYKMAYDSLAKSYFVNKVNASTCYCSCYNSSFNELNHGSEYKEQCIKNKAEKFICFLRDELCQTKEDDNIDKNLEDYMKKFGLNRSLGKVKQIIIDSVTLSYHAKVYENVSNHTECFNNCQETKRFKCVASEIYDGKCYLFDKNFKISYYRNSTVYFVNKVDLSICDCDCKDAKEKGLDFGSQYNERCIRNKKKLFICVLKGESCETRPFINNETTSYNHKEEHENVNDHYNCYKRCINTKTFSCVASEMNKGICYLYDDSFKMAYDSLAKIYFVNSDQASFTTCHCDCRFARYNGLNYGLEYAKRCIGEKYQTFKCVVSRSRNIYHICTKGYSMKDSNGITMIRDIWMKYQKTQNIKIHSEMYLSEKLKQPL